MHNLEVGIKQIHTRSFRLLKKKNETITFCLIFLVMKTFFKMNGTVKATSISNKEEREAN